MPEPLATVEELEARLGRTLDPDEVPMAEAAISDASAMVRAYGLPWPDPETAPDVVRSIVLAASERKMRNPEGLRQEMEGGYQYTRSASTPVGVALTPAEIALLQGVAGIGGIYSVPVESLGGTL